MADEYLIHVAGMTEKPHVRFGAAGAMSLAKTIVDALNEGKEVRIKYVWPAPNLAGTATPSREEQAYIHHWVEETAEVPPEAWDYIRSRKH